MPSILIIGGGFAGVAAAQVLLKSNQATVTLVDRKDYFEVTLAQLRSLVVPSMGDRSRFAYEQILGKAFVHGEVVSLEDNAAVLADGSRLPFDTLILAPGTRYRNFDTAKPVTQTTAALRAEHNQQEHSKFRDAPGFLVIGGGLVGVELAGELASYAPGKPVRLAQAGPRLVEGLSPKASALAKSQLEQMGVKVELNKSKATPENGELVYETVSPEPATAFLRSVTPNILDDRGRIQVDSTLRVKGRTNWFAIGDANDFPDGKRSATATVQGGYVAKGLLSGVWKPYKAQPNMALAPLGKTHGFAELPFGVVTWKFLVNIKRKDLLIGMFRKNLGIKEV